MGDLVHVSRVRIQKERGKEKRAYIEGFPDPVRYGVHGGIKKFYRADGDEDLPATLDHVVAAVGGCLTGTLGGALEARGIPSHPDKLTADVEGFIENIDGKPLITAIRVKYHVKVPKGKKAEAQRALDHHEPSCATSESVRRGIAVQWEGEIEED